MAVIKIKTIKNNLNRVIDYAKNGIKTDEGLLVSAINCLQTDAYEEMALTKRFFHKEDKVQGYHIIQSFNGNEVSAERANEIGRKLADELWGDRFQVIICTHINKANVHNHIIINSVSFIDGKKYHNGKTEIALIKDTSDTLCEEYGLSIIQTEKAEKQKVYRQKQIDKFNHSDEKMQKIINDIDYAIKESKTYEEFKFRIYSKGYEINDRGQHFTVKSPCFSRRVRLDRIFGEEYAVFSIKRKIYYKPKEKSTDFINKKYYGKSYTGPKINQVLLKISSWYRLYVHYLYVFKILPAKNEYKKNTPEYYKNKKENDKIFDEINFMGRHSFESIQEMKEFEESLENKLPELKSKRENLWRRYNKTIDNEKKSEIKKEIDVLSEKIKNIHNNCNICGRCIVNLEKIVAEYRAGELEKQRAGEFVKERQEKKRHKLR